MRLSLFTSSFAFVLFLTGCPQAEPSLDEEGCEHLAEGPATAVTAVAEGEGPLVRDDHRRYDVGLVAVAGGSGGTVRFAADEASDFLIFLGSNVPLVITDSTGAEVEVEETVTGSDTCTEVAVRHLVPLSVGTYRLTFGPSTASSVSVVLEPHAHEHAH